MIPLLRRGLKYSPIEAGYFVEKQVLARLPA